MRTVSFSPPAIKNSLNNDFVCYLINTDGDPSAGSSQAHAPHDQAGQCSEGIGNQNVQTLFLTPNGRIFHTASGFRGPASMSRELMFAKNLFNEIRRRPEAAEQLVMTTHQQKAKAEQLPIEQFDRTPRDGVTDVQNMLRSMGVDLRDRTGRNRNSRGRSNSDSGRTGPGNLHDRIFAAKTEQAKLLDYGFSQNHPMMPIDQFEQNPRLLVGNAVTAFASGPASGGRIGSGNSNARSVSGRSTRDNLSPKN